MKRRYTIYRDEQSFASAEANDCHVAICNVLGKAKVWKMQETKARYTLRDDSSIQFTVVRLPTDDDDCAAWVMDRFRDVRFISSHELEKMPGFVTDTINFGILATQGGLMISAALDSLFDVVALGDPRKNKE